MSKQYVQHISGQGSKYQRRLDGDTPASWCVQDHRGNYLHLPFHDYRPCEPPEVWRDVTEECDWQLYGESSAFFNHKGMDVKPSNGYRLRKVQLFQQSEPDHVEYGFVKKWAFIVEKKVCDE